jgi:flagellar biosynthesis protein FliR
VKFAGAFGLVLTRISGFFVSAPVLGSGNIPIAVRAGLAFTISLVLFPTIDTSSFVVPDGGIRFAFVIATEVLFGVLLGFLAMLALEGFRLAGEVFGVQLGFGMMTVLDPSSEEEETLMDVINYLFVILVFLTMEGHHQFLLAMRKSFDILPLGGIHLTDKLVAPFISTSSDLFLISIQISFPLMAAAMVVTVLLGVVSRAVPRMEVFMLSFPVKILVGLAFMAWLLPWLADYVKWVIGELMLYIIKILPLFG